jgi:hypothetical protein
MKPSEIIAFEKATGIEFSDNFLKSRKTEHVDLRDMFVYMNRKDEPENIMDKLKKNRTSFYATITRFETRYNLYPEYKHKFDELCFKISGQMVINFYADETPILF